MQDIIRYVISYLQRVEVYMQDIIKYVIWYLHKVVSVYVGQYQVRYFVLTKDCKNICRILSGTLFRTYRRQYVYMQDIIRYVISYLQRVVSVYVGYYQVRFFVLTEGSKCICRILSGTLFRTYIYVDRCGISVSEITTDMFHLS